MWLLHSRTARANASELCRQRAAAGRRHLHCVKQPALRSYWNLTKPAAPAAERSDSPVQVDGALLRLRGGELSSCVLIAGEEHSRRAMAVQLDRSQRVLLLSGRGCGGGDGAAQLRSDDGRCRAAARRWLRPQCRAPPPVPHCSCRHRSGASARRCRNGPLLLAFCRHTTPPASQAAHADAGRGRPPGGGRLAPAAHRAALVCARRPPAAGVAAGAAGG